MTGKLISTIKETVTSTIKIITSKESLRSLYGVSLYRNAVYLMLSYAIAAVTAFVFWIAAARFYVVSDVGLGSAAISAMNLLAALSTLGLDYGLVRFLPKSGERSNALINSCFIISGLVSIILAFGFLAGLNIWSPSLLPIRRNLIFFAAFVVFTIIATLRSFTEQSFIAKRRAGFSMSSNLIFGLSRLIFIVILAAFFHTFGIFASWGLGLALAVAISIFLFLPRVQPGYHLFFDARKDMIKEIAHFSFLNYIATLLWAAPALVLPLMVVNLLGAEANGYFYVGWAIGTILFIIPRGISFSLFAEGSYEEEKLGQKIRGSVQLILLFLIPAVVIIILLGNKILLFFGTAYSENSLTLLWTLALSALPGSVNYTYFSVKRVEMKMKSVVGLNAFIAIATLAMSYILFPRLGILGAGISWLVAQSAAAVVIISIIFHRRLIRQA